MQSPTDPLRFPEDFPPTNRWDKFFFGVRWIGPDLSFFKALKDQQARRSPDMMVVWGGGLRQELAERIAHVIAKMQRWKTAVFLPEDSFRVICYGPHIDWGDAFALEQAIEEFEHHYGINIPTWVWRNYESATFGEIVDNLFSLLTHSKAESY